MAEDAYRQASQSGDESRSQAWLLLRLAQGRADVAAGDSPRRRGGEGPREPLEGASSNVEILLATNDAAAARAAADELAGIADGTDLPYLRAVAGHAQGAVLLAEGDARAASKRCASLGVSAASRCHTRRRA